MKRTKVIVIVAVVVVLAAVILAVALFARERQPAFEAVVLDVNEGSLSLYKADGEGDRLLNASISEETKLLGEDGKAAALADIEPGMLVRVTHGDVVLESYPPIYPQVSEVRVLGQADDALYQEGLESTHWMDGLIGDESVPGEDGSPEEPAEETGGDETVVPPADTALYRGEVKEITIENGAATILLGQVTGTDYGMPEARFVIDADTLYKFDLDAVAVGDYLEVWYGVALDGSEAEQPIPVAAANKLLPAESVVYNGTLTTLTDNGDGTGSMHFAPIGSGQEFVFNYDETTQFYLDFATLKAGDQLNIYFSGVATMSPPPQAFALEVRPFAA